MNDLAPWSAHFEELGKPNGSTHWLEADLMVTLDYKSPDSWRRVVNKAVQALVSVDIPVDQHFAPTPQGKKLTRFACYLIAMNADPKKPEVAAAQAYLASLADSFQRLCDHADGVERVLIREELSDGQKALASTAKAHGVINYAFFLNAGYMGMYNMNFARLKELKGLPEGKQIADWMGKEELAANLFRITQTNAKLKNDDVRSQAHAEKVAQQVGQKVRHTMIELSGSAPEDLPLAEPIQSIKKALKGTSRKFRSLDAKK